MAGGGCEGTLLVISECPGPLVSGMVDREEAETGRGSCGRDSELDEEPTLLQDSEPAGEAEQSVSDLKTDTERGFRSVSYSRGWRGVDGYNEAGEDIHSSPVAALHSGLLRHYC